MPKDTLLRFSLLLSLCEASAWIGLNAWDARDPRYQATVTFDVRVIAEAEAWKASVRTAASNYHGNQWRLFRPVFYREVNNLKELYDIIAWKVRDMASPLPQGGRIYQLEVIAGSPEQATEQANSIAATACHSMNTQNNQSVESQELRAMVEYKASAEAARARGDVWAAQGFEANIRAMTMKSKCYMHPVSIWEKASPNNQRMSTFRTPFAQAIILCLPMVGLVLRQRKSSRRLNPQSA